MVRRREQTVSSVPEDHSVKGKRGRKPLKNNKGIAEVDENSREESVYFDKLVNIFDSIQKNEAGDLSIVASKLSDEFMRLSGDEHTSFFSDLLRCLLHILNTGKNNESSDAIIKFIGKELCLSNILLIDGLIRLVCECLINSTEKNIRTKSLALLGTVVETFYEDENLWEQFLNDKKWEELKELIISSAKTSADDKIVSVRVECARVLGPFTIVSPHCLHKVQYLMANDNSKDVRVAAIKNLILAHEILDTFLDRIKDKESEVRTAIMQKIIADDVPIQVLSIQRRIDVLNRGLTDSSDHVRIATKDLVRFWLGTFEYNPTDFVESLDLETSPNESKVIMQALVDIIFESESFSNCEQFLKHSSTGFFEGDGIENEFAYLLTLNEVCEKSVEVGNEELLEAMVPEFSLLYRKISENWFSDENDRLSDNAFVELVKLSKFLDQHNEAAVRNMISLFFNILSSDSEYLADRTEACLPYIVDFCISHNRLSEIEDMFTKLTSSRIESDFMINRVLKFALITLEKMHFSSHSQVADMERIFALEIFVLNLGHSEASIRSLSLKFLCLYAILNNHRQLAYSQVPYIIEILKHDTSESKCDAIKCAFDICLSFGFFIENEDSSTANDLFQSLILIVKDIATVLQCIQCIQSSEDSQSVDTFELELYKLALEGFGKLLIHNRLASETSHDVLVSLLSSFFELKYLFDDAQDFFPFFKIFFAAYVHVCDGSKKSLVSAFCPVAEHVLSLGGVDTEDLVGDLLQCIAFLVEQKTGFDSENSEVGEPDLTQDIETRITNQYAQLGISNLLFIEFASFSIASRRNLTSAWSFATSLLGGMKKNSLCLAMLEKCLDDAALSTSVTKALIEHSSTKSVTDVPELQQAQIFIQAIIESIQTNYCSKFFRAPMGKKIKNTRGKRKGDLVPVSTRSSYEDEQDSDPDSDPQQPISSDRRRSARLSQHSTLPKKTPQPVDDDDLSSEEESEQDVSF